MFSKLKYLLIAVLFTLILAYAAWPTAGRPALGPTNFDAVHLDCFDCATATPVLRVNQASGSGSGLAFVVEGAGTPVFSVDRTGALSVTGGQILTQAVTYLIVNAPTAIGTATPAALVDNAGVSNLLEIRDSATPVFTINNGGAWSSTGAGTHSSGQTINNWAKVAAPTAIATATPAAVIDSAGVSNILEVRDAATPVFAVQNGGNHSFNNGATTLNATSLDLNDTIVDQDLGTENLGGLPSVCTASITYTAAAGGSGTVCSIGANEIWFVHAVYVNVTADWDATGDDAVLVIGDGGDPNGLLDLADAELQAADTEGTGAVAGWQGFMSTDTVGAYLAQGLGFVYNPGSAETIDWAASASGDDLSAGEATIYVVYTRIQ